MKRYGNLWNDFISWENLVLASKKARRGKRDKHCVQSFEFDLESQLLNLQAELVGGYYKPGKFHSHWITRPKLRKISAAPYRDRVVHHALMNVLEPILDSHFHPHSFACRKQKGTHRAADRLQDLMKSNNYALQCDIQKFFPSIDHKILKEKFRRLIKDKRILQLMDLIVDSSNSQEQQHQYFPKDDLFSPLSRRVGIPIGNLTSQWFANWYLDGLDHYITKECRCGSYVRYCDDFIILLKEKDELLRLRENINSYLNGIRLKLHKNKNFIKPVMSGLTFVGMRIWSHHRLLKKDNVKLFKKRVKWMRKAYAYGFIDTDYIKPRLASWLGHSGNTNSYRLVCRLCKDWKFRRATPDELSRFARRQLEQQRQQLYCLEQEQQQPEQHEQQQRVPCVSLITSLLAFSRDSQNGNVYGYCRSGGENPRRCPELMQRNPHSRISTLPVIVGRRLPEDYIRLLETLKGVAA